MNQIARVALVTALVAATVPAVAWENPSGQEFNATAIMTTREGTRRMPVTLIAQRYTSMGEAARLEQVLAGGGQGALLSALRGRSNGRFRLGALEFPVNLVAAEEIRDGYRYVFVTARRIQVEERNTSAESLDYPFGVAIFELGDFGNGEGEVYPAASLSIDDEGGVVIEQYDADPGRLVDVKQVR